jgi:hypothetical protein
MSFPRTIPMLGSLAALAAVVLVASSWPDASASDAPSNSPQIQGEHLRVEFDRSLRSRVIARFAGTETQGIETAMGPFVASETATTGDKTWTAFPLVSEKSD